MTKLRSLSVKDGMNRSKSNALPSKADVLMKKPRFTVSDEVRLASLTRKNVYDIQAHGGLVSTSYFKATPVPLTTYKKPVGVPPKKPAKVTVPESPNIMKPAKKLALPTEIQCDQAPEFKARPAPHFGKPFEPSFKHKHSEPHPMHFPGDSIAEEKRKKFQEALERERQEAQLARQFRARPVPDYSTMNQRHGSCENLRPLTKPEPFNLESERRHKQYQEELKHKLQEEEERFAKERQFHSRPAPHVAPFMPKKSTRPLTQTEQVHLHSSERAIKRQEFEEHLKCKEREAIERERKLEEERHQREKEEIRRLRKELIPKARPVPHYPPAIIKPTGRKLTVPISPSLQTSIRSKIQRHSDQ